MTEWEKMLAGERYHAAGREFVERLNAVKDRLREFNTTRPSDVERRDGIVRGLLGHVGERFTLLQPFYCDYGCNISIGDDFFANFNLTILDEGRVTIGDHVFIGPNVGIYTACHPLDPAERNTGDEWAEPVTIGDNVWIGGGVTICPGVTIGEGTTIGAGSVVVRNIPARCVAVGNPARVVKRLPG